jgi:hypothetical protein
MKHWFWVCNMTRYPTLWDEWKKRGVASLGWPPEFVASNPKEEARLLKNLKQANRMDKGDLVVAYLKKSRIGGIGVLKRRIRKDVWTPIADGDHGRLAEVDWQWLPREGCYAFPPEGTIPRRMWAIYSIKDTDKFDLLMKAVEDERTWGALRDSKYLAKNEKENLHPLIAENLELLEKGLHPNRWGRLCEYPAWPAGFIDLLAEDSAGNPVIVEAKRHSCGDETIGQVLRYRAWIRQNIGARKKIRAMIVAGEFRFAPSKDVSRGLPRERSSVEGH